MTYEFVKLKYLSQVPISNGLGLPGEHDNPDWPRYIRTTDIASPTSLRDDVFASQPPDVASKAQVAGGDILMTAAGATIGKSVLLTDVGEACYAGFLVRYRPNNRVDGRFVAYWMQSQQYWDQISVGAVRSTIDNFSASKYRELQVPLPAVEEQRRIADFLDDQVARIDEALQIGNSQLDELGALAGQRFLAELAEGQEALNWPCVRLGHLLRQFTNGYVGPTRDLLVEEGVPYVQSLHIKNGQIDFDRRPYFVPQDWHDARPRIHLREGDVLIVQTGDIGSIAVVPEGFMEASCHALIIVRPRAELISSEYLGEFLRSPLGQSELLSRATGALHPHLESGIKDAVIVVPPLADQDRITRTMRAVRGDVRTTTSAGIQRRSLLEERKRALITAAVTGEMDVTTAKPIGMGKWVPNVGATVDAPATAQASSIGGIG